jgi:hypothetical protein
MKDELMHPDSEQQQTTLPPPPDESTDSAPETELDTAEFPSADVDEHQSAETESTHVLDIQPEAPEATKRFPIKWVVAPVAAIALVAGGVAALLAGGGDESSETETATNTETTADDTESTTTSTQEIVDEIEIHSVREVMPALFTRESMMNLIGTQQGDYIKSLDVRDTDPYSGETAAEGRLSTYDMLIWNDDPNLPAPGVGRANVSLYDLEIMENILTEEEGPPPDGLEPWGSIANEEIMWDAELFTFTDTTGREYQASYLQGRLRIDAGQYSLGITLQRNDPANPEQSVRGSLFENGVVAPYFQDVVDRVVRGVFHGEISSVGEPYTAPANPTTTEEESTTSTTVINGHTYGRDSNGVAVEIIENEDGTVTEIPYGGE